MNRVGQAPASDSRGHTGSPVRSLDLWALLKPNEVAPSALANAGTDKGYTLDLNGLKPEDLERVTRVEVEKLSSRHAITHLVLPHHTNKLPPGINALPDLQKLELPGFTGTELDLHGLQVDRTLPGRALEISIPDAPALRKIRVDSTLLAIKHLRFDVRPLHTRKVILDDKIKTHERPVPGHTYDRELMGRGARDSKEADEAYKRAKRLDLNSKVALPDGDGQAVCRHLALAHLLDHIDHRRMLMKHPGPMRPRWDSTAMSDAALLKKALPKGLEKTFEEITTRTQENHLVSVSRWHDFLCDRFKAMAPGQFRQFLVLSANHAMHMELQAKCRDEKTNDVDCVVKFYDPARTAMPSRTILDPTSVPGCELKNLLPNPTWLQDYFGSTPDLASALVMGVDEADLHADDKRQGTPKRREDYRFAGAQFTPGGLHLLVAFGLFDGLVQYLKQTLGDPEIKDQPLAMQLQARDANGAPVLAKVLEAGHAQATQAMLDAMFEAAAAGRISSTQLEELFQAKLQCGTPALLLALQNGHAQAAKALLDTLFKAAAHGLINQKQLANLLLAKAEVGTTALYMALQHGRVEATQTLLFTVFKAAAAGYIDRTQLAQLLQAKAENGTPALLIALHMGHTPAAHVLLDTMLKAAANRLIDLREVFLEEDFTPQHHALSLLAARPEQAKRHEASLRRLISTLTELPADRKSRPPTLDPRDKTALQGLCRACMAANLDGWVDVLAHCLHEASGLDPKVRAEILLAQDPATGASAFSIAMERGNTLALQSWRRAVKALPLEPSAKKALLAGTGTA